METSIESPWLTVKEAADYLRRNPQTVSAALRDGTLAGHQPQRKGKWLIHREALDAWVRGEVADVQPKRVARGKKAS